MQNFLQFRRHISVFRLLVLLCFSFLSFTSGFSQSGGQLSTFLIEVNSSHQTRPAMLWLPAGYQSETCEYPLLVFLHGLGECGTSDGNQVHLLKSYGPLGFLDGGQWNGQAIYNSNIYKFIVFAIQAPRSPDNNCYSFIDPGEVDYAITQLSTQYRVDLNKIVLTGLSAGGNSTVEYVLDPNRVNKAKHIIPMSVPFQSGSGNSNLTTLAQGGMKVWAFTYDPGTSNFYTTTAQLVANFNNASANSARHTHTEHISHCCWETYYNPGYTQQDFDGSSDILNIYQWAAKKLYNGQAASCGGGGGNQPPTANAGSDQTISTSTTTLNGSGMDNDGTVTSYSWTKVSGTGGTIVSPNSASTQVTGLSSGVYVFKLTVTDNGGATGNDNVNVTVNTGGGLNLVGYVQNTSQYSTCPTSGSNINIGVYSNRSLGQVAGGDILYDQEGAPFNGQHYYWAFTTTNGGSSPDRGLKIGFDGTVLDVCLVGLPTAKHFSNGGNNCSGTGVNALYAAQNDPDLYNGKRLFANSSSSQVAANGDYAVSNTSGGNVTHTFTISNGNGLITDLQACGSQFNLVGYVQNTSQYSTCPTSGSNINIGVYSNRSLGQVAGGDILYDQEGAPFNGQHYYWAFTTTNGGSSPDRGLKIGFDGTVLDVCLVGLPTAKHFSNGGNNCSGTGVNALYAAQNDPDLYNGKRLFANSSSSQVAANGDYAVSNTSGGNVTHTFTIIAGNGLITDLQACGGGGVARINVTSEQANKASLRIYPNPASSFVMIEGLRQLPNGIVGEIIDANGRTIQKIRLNSDRQRIDTKTWNKGIYLVRILDSKGSLLLTKKLIIQ